VDTPAQPNPGGFVRLTDVKVARDSLERTVEDQDAAVVCQSRVLLESDEGGSVGPARQGVVDPEPIVSTGNLDRLAG
jgi:hypothetical protein